MIRAEAYKSISEAIGRLEKDAETDLDTLIGLLKLRKNAVIYQKILTAAIVTAPKGSELDDAILQARKGLNDIMPLLNRAIIWRSVPFFSALLKHRKSRALRPYKRARESVSYAISLFDPVLADYFDASCA